jgi:hypothetical protein
MKLFRTRQGIIVEEAGTFSRLAETDWDSLINNDDRLRSRGDLTRCSAPAAAELLAPIGKCGRPG